MPNVQKRPCSDLVGVHEDIEHMGIVDGGQEAPRSSCAARDRAHALPAAPEGGPADLDFLLQLSKTCMSKDVRAAVQKAAAGAGADTSLCPFLGVRRKQRYSHQLLKLDIPIMILLTGIVFPGAT